MKKLCEYLSCELPTFASNGFSFGLICVVAINNL